MGKSKLTITHPDVSYGLLDEYLSQSCPARIGLRIAILQGVMDRVPIDTISRRRHMSRQGIYNLVKRVNEEGIKGLEGKRRGRPGRLTKEIARDLKKILIQSPVMLGYRQLRWDNALVREYLREKHHIDIGRNQLMNWLRVIDSDVKLVRKKYRSAVFVKQNAFADDAKNNQNQQSGEIIIFPDIAGFQKDAALALRRLTEGNQHQLFSDSVWNRDTIQEKVNILINQF